MTEWTTLTVSAETRAYLEQRKPDSMTWDEYLQRGYDTLETREFVDSSELQLESRLDDLETAIKHKIERETRR
jgi:hypothetical protein